MAGGVEEGDSALFAGSSDVLHFISGEMLGDTTRLSSSHVGLSNVVQKRRLAVVDVAHDGDNWWARYEVGGGFWTHKQVVTIPENGLFAKEFVFNPLFGERVYSPAGELLYSRQSRCVMFPKSRSGGEDGIQKTGRGAGGGLNQKEDETRF